MTDPSKRLAVLGVLLATFIAAPASADPNSAADKANSAADKANSAADKAKAAGAKAEAAGAKAEKAGEKAEKAGEKAEKAGEKAEKAGEKAEEKAGEAKQQLAQAHAEFRGGLRLLREELHDGKLKKEEIKDRLAKLHETMKERRTAHREALKVRWGDVLAKPDAREELRHHARRMAFLDRALLLAETERTGKDKDKLTERIQKLIDKEGERHARAMERIKSGQAPVAAAAASGNTTPAGAAVGKPETSPAADKAAAPAAAKGATPAEGDKK